MIAAELSAGLGVTRPQGVANSSAMSPESVVIALGELLQAVHKLMDATVASVERWRSCFHGYLKDGALGACAVEWSTFDATWGSRIAGLSAQVYSVDAVRHEVAAAGPHAKIDEVWRYVKSVIL